MVAFEFLNLMTLGIKPSYLTFPCKTKLRARAYTLVSPFCLHDKYYVRGIENLAYQLFFPNTQKDTKPMTLCLSSFLVYVTLFRQTLHLKPTEIGEAAILSLLPIILD